MFRRPTEAGRHAARLQLAGFAACVLTSSAVQASPAMSSGASILAAAAKGAPHGHTPAPAGSVATGQPPVEVTELFALTIRMNRIETGLILPLMRHGGRWQIDRDELAKLPVRPPEGWAALPLVVSLDRELGFEIEFEPLEQRMNLTVPVSWLAHNVTRMGDPLAGPTSARMTGPAGVVVNYDLAYTQAYDGSRGGGSASQLAAMSEIRWFNKSTGLLTHTQLNQFRQGGLDGGWGGNSVRLDTRWEETRPDALLRWQFGDGITDGGTGMRSIRFGGLRIGTDFDLQPYRTTSTLPTWFGSVALPSTVDVYIDGMRRYHAQVPPGAVALDAVPGITGSGQASVVVTDALGRMQAFEFPFYSTTRLLQPGLSNWSLSAGVARLDYGFASNRYGNQLIVNGRYRLGMTPFLTSELSFEATEGSRTIGLLAVIAPGQIGVFSPRISASDSSRPIGSRLYGGSHVGLGYEWTRRRLSVYADFARTTPGYRDVASHFGSYWASRTQRIGLGWMTLFGSVGANWVRQVQYGGHEGRFVSANWYRALAENWGVQLTLSHSLAGRADTVAVLGITRTLGQRRSVAASQQMGRDRRTTAVAMSQAMTPDDRESWRVQAHGGHGDPAVQVDMAREWAYARGQAQIYGRGDQVNGWLGAQGALAWLGGHRLAARSLPDAFGLVSTEGVADVSVRLENRLIGRTDGKGLLVTPLFGWLSNQVSVDALELPADLRIDAVQQQVVGRGRAGTLIRFPMRRIRAATLTLIDESGRPVAQGASVRTVTGAARAGAAASAIAAPAIAGPAIPAPQTTAPGLALQTPGAPTLTAPASADAANPPAQVGYDGEVWLEDLADGHNEIDVALEDGRRCAARFDYPASTASPARFGPLVCRGAASPEKT